MRQRDKELQGSIESYMMMFDCELEQGSNIDLLEGRCCLNWLPQGSVGSREMFNLSMVDV